MSIIFMNIRHYVYHLACHLIGYHLALLSNCLKPILRAARVGQPFNHFSSLLLHLKNALEPGKTRSAILAIPFNLACI